jgi:hypothetical protein
LFPNFTVGVADIQQQIKMSRVKYLVEKAFSFHKILILTSVGGAGYYLGRKTCQETINHCVKYL